MNTEATQDTAKFYFQIWEWLIILLVVGTVIVFMPVSRGLALTIVFAVAAIKGVLVVRNYMHLKHEHLIFYLIAGLPPLLVIIMLLALLPDIAFRH
ncbi:MAG TPA: cytochrome C oxidase subunit IV family protein [Candidatus Binataceae bacterium]|nr:cytochrome C oxidase subunit IV family protein [Candidatus Binataceae bacterium]